MPTPGLEGRRQSIAARADAVVVGAGVVGAAVARTLARDGVQVVVLDAAPDLGGGCSYANAAILAPSHVGPLATLATLMDAARAVRHRPPAVRVHADRSVVPWLAQLAATAGTGRVRSSVHPLRQIAEYSGQLHAQLHDEGLSPTYAPVQLMDVYLNRPRVSLRRRELLDAVQLQHVEPALGQVWAGTPPVAEAVTESRSFIRSMLADAAARGAQIHFGQPVREVVTDAGRVCGVQTDFGMIQAEHVVICAGLGGKSLAADLGVRLPLRGGRGYVVDLEAPITSPRCAVRLADHRVVITPLSDRVRVAGFMEFGAERRPIDHARAGQLVDLAKRTFPALTGQPVLEEWAGERPCLPDGLPAIGASSTAAGLFFAIGHGMWGLVLAPATGELIVRELRRPHSGQIPLEFHPDRFGRHGSRAW